MSSIYDLHTHTIFSDGILTPEELVLRAHSKNVDCIALTDHDSTQGLAAMRHHCALKKIQFVPGVEISAVWRNITIHVVGLQIDEKNISLQKGLEHIREQRTRRSRLIADKLERVGISNVMPDIIELAGTAAATRTHFARLLIQRRKVRGMQEAFKKYLGKKGKAFVAGEWAELTSVLKWIVEAGGYPVLAHPARYNMTRTKMHELLKEFKEMGGVGIEVATSSHNITEKKHTAEFAKHFDLYASVGSDFHTPANPRVDLGQNLSLPDICKPIWTLWDA